MAAPAFWDDNRRAQELIRERAELARTVGRIGELATQASDLAVLLELAQESGDDGSLDAEIAEGATRLRRELGEFELKIMLSGPHDAKPAILSIHPGAGGTESQDWAQMLMRMYLRWCEREGFKAEVVDLLPGEEAGIKSVTIEVTGEYAYGYLRGEIGVHRLIRISPFDSSSRRQTSFASVSAVPEVDDVEVNIREDDLRVDVFRSSGPGGQGVNTADSAVRITHLPTNIVVSCQNERSQLQNKDRAMRMLRAKLALLAEEQAAAAASDARKAQVRTVDRSERIRTYNFPQNRISDHRIGFTAYNLDLVIGGDLDGVLDALTEADRAARLAGEADLSRR